MTSTFRGSSCSTIPALKSTSTNSFDEPSCPGGSGASNCTKQLSIRRPANAAMTCSVISTTTLPEAIAVRRLRGTAYSMSAGTGAEPAQSVRWNAMPWFAGAGKKRSETSAPVKKPIPLVAAAWRIVHCARSCIVPPLIISPHPIKPCRRKRNYPLAVTVTRRSLQRLTLFRVAPTSVWY